MGLPKLDFDGRANNVLKSTQRGAGNFEVGEGIYFCGAFTYPMIGHCFVLEVKANEDRWFLDEEVVEGRFRFNKETASWMQYWNFVIAFKLIE